MLLSKIKIPLRRELFKRNFCNNCCSNDNNICDYAKKIINEFEIIRTNDKQNILYDKLTHNHKHIYTFDICPSFEPIDRQKILKELKNTYHSNLIVYDFEHSFYYGLKSVLKNIKEKHRPFLIY